MSDVVVRVAAILVLVALAVGVARLAARWQRPVHRSPDLGGLGMPAGIVVFTSTDCASCRDALAAAEDTGAPIRQVAHELEPDLFEKAGVEAVPLTVVLDDDGSVTATFAGVPRARRLRRAVRDAGF